PDTVKGLVLRGIFLCRPSELRWFYQEGASNIFPDYWEEYLAPIPPEERHDMMAAYYKRLTHENPEVRLGAARAWSRWEGATATMTVEKEKLDAFEDPTFALAFARIECHYFVNNAFFPTTNYILENIGRIRHIPGWIVQGRYDMVCPARSAWELHRAWPESKIEIVPVAAHAASDPGIRSALIKATDEARGLWK
ncbi:MAG: prolyl aminopeptidase, partial [Bdellovibrionaceae bacterium]|nr:prolyl aminopeptidase [Pseudobdellovibrionaceae bacterium]